MGWFAQLSGEVQLALIALFNVLSVTLITAWRESRKPPPLAPHLETAKTEAGLVAAALEGLNFTLIKVEMLLQQDRTADSDMKGILEDIHRSLEDTRELHVELNREIREMRVEMIRSPNKRSGN